MSRILKDFNQQSWPRDVAPLERLKALAKRMKTGEVPHLHTVDGMLERQYANMRDRYGHTAIKGL